MDFGHSDRKWVHTPESWISAKSAEIGVLRTVHGIPGFRPNLAYNWSYLAQNGPFWSIFGLFPGMTRNHGFRSKSRDFGQNSEIMDFGPNHRKSGFSACARLALRSSVFSACFS